MVTIIVLSFQGPTGGLTFPLHGVSTHWFVRLWDGLGVVDIWAAFGRSRPRGHALADLPSRGAAAHRAVAGRDRVVWIHALVGRGGALQPGVRQRSEHAAARADRPHDDRHQPGDLRAGHGDHDRLVR